MFKCNKCGQCCRNLRLNSLYAYLDDGTGCCKYLKGNECSIYYKRPVICNVDKCYELYFSNIMTLEEYYKKNMEACEILKNKKSLNKY